MNSILRVTAVVVLVGMVAALPGAQAFAVSRSAHTESCHSHTRTPMSPASYQCCANGHNWAIAGSPVLVFAPALTDSRVDQDPQWLQSGQTLTFTFLSSSPPAVSPLRI